MAWRQRLRINIRSIEGARDFKELKRVLGEEFRRIQRWANELDSNLTIVNNNVFGEEGSETEKVRFEIIGQAEGVDFTSATSRYLGRPGATYFYAGYMVTPRSVSGVSVYPIISVGTTSSGAQLTNLLDGELLGLDQTTEGVIRFNAGRSNMVLPSSDLYLTVGTAATATAFLADIFIMGIRKDA